jgi:hypothetical protein
LAESADLAALQQRFFALVTAREDVAGALARFGLHAEDAAALVAGDARLDAVGRIGIYNDMYFMRLRGVLAQDFSALLALLGEDDFRALVADYLDGHPPRDPCLRELGRALPRFLAARGDAERPWIADLAALEWARADVFDRPDAAPLTAADLQALAPEQFATLPLRAVPASAIVDVGFAVDQVWRTLEDARAQRDARDDEGDDDAFSEPVAIAAPAAGALRLLVWRDGTEIYHRCASADEAPLLPALLAGTTFGALCEQLGQDRSIEVAAELAFGFLAAWIHGGLLAAPTPP